MIKKEKLESLIKERKCKKEREKKRKLTNRPQCKKPMQWKLWRMCKNPNCNIRFKKKHGNQKYHSIKCRNEADYNRLKKDMERDPLKYYKKHTEWCKKNPKKRSKQIERFRKNQKLIDNHFDDLGMMMSLNKKTK